MQQRQHARGPRRTRERSSRRGRRSGSALVLRPADQVGVVPNRPAGVPRGRSPSRQAPSRARHAPHRRDTVEAATEAGSWRISTRAHPGSVAADRKSSPARPDLMQVSLERAAVPVAAARRRSVGRPPAWRRRAACRRRCGAATASNSHWAGHLEARQRGGAKARSSSAVRRVGRIGCTTKALMASPSSRSGTLITAASAIRGCSSKPVFDLHRVDVLAAPDDHVSARYRSGRGSRRRRGLPRSPVRSQPSGLAANKVIGAGDHLAAPRSRPGPRCAPRLPAPRGPPTGAVGPARPRRAGDPQATAR